MLNRVFSLLIFLSVSKNNTKKKFRYNNVVVLYMSYDLYFGLKNFFFFFFFKLVHFDMYVGKICQTVQFRKYFRRMACVQSYLVNWTLFESRA